MNNSDNYDDSSKDNHAVQYVLENQPQEEENDEEESLHPTSNSYDRAKDLMTSTEQDIAIAVIDARSNRNNDDEEEGKPTTEMFSSKGSSKNDDKEEDLLKWKNDNAEIQDVKDEEERTATAMMNIHKMEVDSSVNPTAQATAQESDQFTDTNTLVEACENVTGLNRQQNRNLAPPGAYRVIPRNPHRQHSQCQQDDDNTTASNTDDSGDLEEQQPANDNSNNNEVMVSASLVKDITVEAKPADDEDHSSSILCCGIQRNHVVASFIILLVVAVVAIVVAFSVAKGNKNDSHSSMNSAPALPTKTIYPQPTYPPVSFDDASYEDTIQEIVLTYVSEKSVASIQNKVSNSASYQAFQWIVEEDLLIKRLYDEERSQGFQERVLQRYSLATVWYSMNGPTTWIHTDGWMTDTNECDWYTAREDGVPTCTAKNDLYYGLELQFNNITGSIPDDIFLLRDIEFLSLESNAISGSLPTELGLLSSLRYLVLLDNKFTGTIPTEIGRLTRLEELDMTDNNLSGTLPEELGNEDISNLLFALFFNNPKLEGTIPESYGKLPSLEFLQTHPCTNITGTVPQSICDAVEDSWLEVIVECETIECDCCACIENEPPARWICPEK